MVKDLGVRVYGFCLRLQGKDVWVQDIWFRVEDCGLGVQ